MEPVSFPDDVMNPRAKALFEQGLTAQREKQYSLAVIHYRHSLESSDDVNVTFAGMLNIALCHGQLGDWSAADAGVREVLIINPRSRTALDYLREVCRAQGLSDEAAAISELMLRI